MIIGLGFLAAVALGSVLYVFLSKKTSRPHKMAALIALVLSGIALGVCGVVLFTAAGVEKEEDPYSFYTAAEPPPSSSSGANLIELVIFLILLLIALVVIIYLGVKDRKKRMLKEAVSDIKDSDFSSLDDL